MASEALLHWLCENHCGGWRPKFIKHEGEPHWFLRHDSGLILDVTADQFKTTVPYKNAVGKGFLTSFPSKRAKVVLERLRKKQDKRQLKLAV